MLLMYDLCWRLLYVTHEWRKYFTSNKIHFLRVHVQGPAKLESRAWVNLIHFHLLITDMLKLEVGLGLPIPITGTKIAYVNFPVHLKFRGFMVPCIVLTPFYTDDEVSWLRNTESHPRWAAPSDLRHLGLKRYPS